jgi:hypothetical protein
MILLLPMQETVKKILSAKRRRFLQSKPVFHFTASTTEMDLFRVARRLDCKLTVGLCKWLRAAGYGDIDGTLFFREDCFSVINEGTLSKYVAFARDELDNVYAFDSKDGAIYFIDPHQAGYARMSKDFLSFLIELTERDYQLPEWRTSLALTKYL